MGRTTKATDYVQPLHQATTRQAGTRVREGGTPSARKRGRPAWRSIVAVSVLSMAVATPAWAQQAGNPFAGRALGGRGPYGSDAGATMHVMQIPHVAHSAVGAAAGRPRGATVVAVREGERTESVERLESDGSFWEILFASCVGGAFLGGVTALASTEIVAVGTAAVAPAGLALPVLAGAAASAAGIGCGLGASTAAISMGAAGLWQRMFR